MAKVVKVGPVEAPQALVRAPLNKAGQIWFFMVVSSGFGSSSDGAFTATPGNLYKYSNIPTKSSFFLCAALICFLVTRHSAGREKGDVCSLPPALNV